MEGGGYDEWYLLLKSSQWQSLLGRSSNANGSQNAVSRAGEHPGACSSLNRPRSTGVILPGKEGRAAPGQDCIIREAGTKALARTTEDVGKGSSGLRQKPWDKVSLLLPLDYGWICLIRFISLYMTLHLQYRKRTHFVYFIRVTECSNRRFCSLNLVSVCLCMCLMVFIVYSISR